jgi:hypothetical protein
MVVAFALAGNASAQRHGGWQGAHTWSHGARGGGHGGEWHHGRGIGWSGIYVAPRPHTYCTYACYGYAPPTYYRYLWLPPVYRGY